MTSSFKIFKNKEIFALKINKPKFKTYSIISHYFTMSQLNEKFSKYEILKNLVVLKIQKQR